MRSLAFACSAAVALLLLGCRTTPTRAPSPIPSPTTTSIAIVTETIQAAALTPTATFTAEPSPTPTTSPSPTSEPAIAWVDTLHLHSLPGPGRNPSAMIVVGQCLYVANRASDNVSVIEDMRVVQVLPVGSQPVALSADAAGERVYVANLRDDTISVISDNRVVATWDTGAEPCSLTAVGERLYVASRREPAVYVHAARTGEPLGSIGMGSGPGVLNMAAHAGLGRLYVSTYHQVHVIDLEAQSVIDSVEYSNYSTLAVNPASGRVFINDYDADEGQEYLVSLDEDAQNPRDGVAIDPDPGWVAFNERTGKAYVTSTWADTLTVIEEGSGEVLSVVGVGRRPDAVAIDEGRNVIYVANSESNNIAVVDGSSNRVVDIIPLAVDVGGLTVDAATDRLYATMTSMDRLIALEGSNSVGEVEVGRHPVDLALNEMTGLVYVVNRVDSSLCVVDGVTLQVVTTVPLNERPFGVSVDTGRNVIYAGNAVIDGNTNEVIGRINVPTAYHMDVPPVDTLADPTRGTLLVRASNGVPGSNAGLVISMWDGRTMEMLTSALGGVSAGPMALDASTQKLYSVASKFSNVWLYVDDLQGMQRTDETRLDRYPTDLALRSSTHHLFLGLGGLHPPEEGGGYVLRVLDVRTLGQVEELPLPGSPAHIAVNERTGRVYVADGDAGVVYVAQDRTAPPPPVATLTVTQSP